MRRRGQRKFRSLGSTSPSPEGRGVRGEVPITRNQSVAPEKLELAKQLRRAMTPEERVLWSSLRNNALAGLHFRRQQVIAGFIVDFYCASARLAIEVDGAVHMGRQDYDAERDRVLSESGVRTLRLKNESITQDLAGALRRIAKEATSPLTRCP